MPTPIGNLEDITLRALRLFKQADLILCEDSRVTRKLLNLLGVENKPKYVDLTRNHSFNWSGVSSVLDKLSDQQFSSEEIITDDNGSEYKVLLVSDSGTPAISDPGREVITMAIKNGLKFTILPGASAVIPATVFSNLIKKEFVFLGFLPLKKGRSTAWKAIITSQTPLVIYESSHRIIKFLNELSLNLEPEREVCVCNDISKMYETVWRFRAGQVSLQQIPAKGEFVIIISGVSKLSQSPIS
ncbi:MAG: 16S rRNA (cytidine(1402)-2'-O)-methyltransferase [Patescibacteria group bacterium]